MRNRYGFLLSLFLLSAATLLAVNEQNIAAVVLALSSPVVSRLSFRPSIVALSASLLPLGFIMSSLSTALSLLVALSLLISIFLHKRHLNSTPPKTESYEIVFDNRTSKEPLVSVVLPSYNPGPRFQATVSETHSVLNSVSKDSEIIVIDDGSTDGSCVLEPSPGVLFVRKSNGGKGSALSIGFSLASGNLIGFIDADGDVPPDSLLPLIEHLLKDQSLVAAVSSKRHPQSLAPSQSLSRRIFSLGFRTLMRVLAPTGVSDSQVGCKVFRGSSLKSILPSMRQSSFLVDVEILVLLKPFGPVASSPVSLRERLSSTVRLKHILGMFAGLLSLSTLSTHSS